MRDYKHIPHTERESCPDIIGHIVGWALFFGLILILLYSEA